MSAVPEWNDLRFFLELARAGTLSGASRRLGVEHTTVARRIDRLETQLGSTLFDRSREGYGLTDMGHLLLPHAEAMEAAAFMASDQIGQNEGNAQGTVRLGVPEMFGTLVIAPLMADWLRRYPQLQLDLLILPRFANLANREADLGVMLDAPTTGRYIVARLCTFRLHLVAAPSYLARHPPIRQLQDLAQHDFIDYVQDRLASDELNFLAPLGFVPRRRLCCTGMMAQCEAAAAGLGLMMAPPYALLKHDNLVPVLPEQFFIERSYWIAAPSDLYRLKRVRVVWNALREHADSHPELFFRGRSPLQ